MTLRTTTAAVLLSAGLLMAGCSSPSAPAAPPTPVVQVTTPIALPELAPPVPISTRPAGSGVTPSPTGPPGPTCAKLLDTRPADGSKPMDLNNYFTSAWRDLILGDGYPPFNTLTQHQMDMAVTVMWTFKNDVISACDHPGMETALVRDVTSRTYAANPRKYAQPS